MALLLMHLMWVASAFQLPPSIPPTRHINPSATALHGKLWKRLQIDEDDPADGTSWYLINCVAGVELDLLNQCRQVCAHFPEKDVEKFVVPTERHLRSHGDKKKVVDVKVRYPGYVFCKIRLLEDVYETLQELELARSWMGTVNRKGHKKLPPAPLPLNDEEVKKFKGLEDAQEVFEDMFGGDYTGRNDTGADLMAQYEGYDVGQMVKILKGNFEGEDGTVRRLKGGQLMVRLFTYGQTYDEWFDPDAIRPLTDVEVMRGLSGPTVPINQDQFDVSIGKKDPSILEDSSGDNAARTGSIRSGLLQSAGHEQRNRREDRVARGETGNRDMFGRTTDDIKKEEQNWLAYREEKRAGQRGAGSDLSTSAGQTETKAKKEKAKGPPKGKDTWGIVERSSWTGGEVGFEDSSGDDDPLAWGTRAEREERERRLRMAEVYKDRVPRGRRGRDGRGSFDQRQNFRGDFDDRRERNTRERRPVPHSRDRNEREDNWQASPPSKDDDKEDDFFDSLMSELSQDLDEDKARTRGSRHHDNAGPSTKVTEKSSGTEDSFFENLMSELGGSLDEPEKAKSDTTMSDDDDFFSNLEAELSQSLDLGSDKPKAEDDDGDFFASLQQEIGSALDEPPNKVNKASLQDDFFSNLIDDIADELESSSPAQEPNSKQSSSETQSDQR